MWSFLTAGQTASHAPAFSTLCLWFTFRLPPFWRHFHKSSHSIRLERAFVSEQKSKVNCSFMCTTVSAGAYMCALALNVLDVLWSLRQLRIKLTGSTSQDVNMWTQATSDSPTWALPFPDCVCHVWVRARPSCSGMCAFAHAWPSNPLRLSSFRCLGFYLSV